MKYFTLKVTNEILNAERPALPPPNVIHYAEKHVSNVLDGLLKKFGNIETQNLFKLLFSFSKSVLICIKQDL